MSDLEYLEFTASLMRGHGIRVRDTYLSSQNVDDFYGNGNRYDGPRLFKIDWVDSPDYPEIKFNRIYHAPPLQSAAYDSAILVIPLRYNDGRRNDAIIHECVHFLQHNTVEEDQRYIKFTGTNYPEYLGQRVELEAHLVQVAYIRANYPDRFETHLGEADRNFVVEMLEHAKSGSLSETILEALLRCKAAALI